MLLIYSLTKYIHSIISTNNLNNTYYIISVVKLSVTHLKSGNIYLDLFVLSWCQQKH